MSEGIMLTLVAGLEVQPFTLRGTITHGRGHCQGVANRGEFRASRALSRYESGDGIVCRWSGLRERSTAADPSAAVR
jgi:hypothetical protein